MFFVGSVIVNVFLFMVIGVCCLNVVVVVVWYGVRLVIVCFVELIDVVRVMFVLFLFISIIMVLLLVVFVGVLNVEMCMFFCGSVVVL